MTRDKRPGSEIKARIDGELRKQTVEGREIPRLLDITRTIRSSNGAFYSTYPGGIDEAISANNIHRAVIVDDVLYSKTYEGKPTLPIKWGEHETPQTLENLTNGELIQLLGSVTLELSNRQEAFADGINDPSEKPAPTPELEVRDTETVHQYWGE